LITKFTTHFPGLERDLDVFGFLWNNWWISHALIDLHRSPFFTDFVFAPFEIDLRLHTFGFLYGVLTIPATVLIGPVAALNLQALATIVLNGCSVFMLAGYLTRDDRAAFIAGLLVAATPAINFHLAVGRVSCAAVWPAVLCLYFLLRLLDRPRTSNALSLSASLWALLAADQQIALFGLLWMCVLLGSLAPFRWREIVDLRFLRAGVLVAALVSPVAYWLYVQPFVGESEYTVPGAIEAATYSYPIWLLWTPSMLWRVYGTVLVGGIFSALFVAFRTPSIVPWLAGAILFIALSFGPRMAGADVPTPFAVLSHLPGMAQFRTPYRFQIPAAIGGAMCVAFIVSWLRSVRSERAVTAIVASIAIVAAIDLVMYQRVYGFPIQTRTHHPAYSMIPDDGDAGVLLEVPLGVRSGTDVIGTGEALSFHQPLHRRRLVNGMVARVPLAALNYYRASPALMFLAGEVESGGDLEADLSRRLRELKVSYLVVHLDLLGEQRGRAVLDVIARLPDVEQTYADRDVVMFRRRSEAAVWMGP
jgi:hypothetical protein